MPSFAKILTVCNHKGGVGKTTTVVNLAAELGRMGFRVLVIDLDPQGNAGGHIGQPDREVIPTKNASDLFRGEAEDSASIVETDVNQGFENVHLIYASRELLAAERQIREKSVRPYEVLRKHIGPFREHYDIILIDTRPDLDLLTGNALAASDACIIPIETKTIYGLHGTADLLDLIEQIRGAINPILIVLGILLTRHSDRLNLSKSIESAAAQGLGSVLPIAIRETSKIGESSVRQVPVRLIDKRCSAAEDYEALAQYVRDTLSLARERA